MLTFVGANRHCGIPEQELVAGDSGVIHHAPADVGVHGAALVAAVYELQAQLEVVAHADLQGRQDQVNISQRRVGLLSFTAVLLRFFQNGPLLFTA